MFNSYDLLCSETYSDITGIKKWVVSILSSQKSCSPNLITSYQAIGYMKNLPCVLSEHASVYLSLFGAAVNPSWWVKCTRIRQYCPIIQWCVQHLGPSWWLSRKHLKLGDIRWHKQNVQLELIFLKRFYLNQICYCCYIRNQKIISYFAHMGQIWPCGKLNLSLSIHAHLFWTD